MEDPFEKGAIGLPPNPLLNFIHAPRGPGMHRRVDVPKRPFVGRDLAIGVHIPLAQEEGELVFRKVRVNEGQANAVECQVPGGVPRIFPFVGHGDDVFVVDMPPVAIPSMLTFGRRGRARRVACQPLLHLIVVKLLAPQQPGQGLPHHQPGVVREPGGNDGGVKLVRLVPALPEELDESPAKRRALGRGIAQA